MLLIHKTNDSLNPFNTFIIRPKNEKKKHRRPLLLYTDYDPRFKRIKKILYLNVRKQIQLVVRVLKQNRRTTRICTFA